VVLLTEFRKSADRVNVHLLHARFPEPAAASRKTFILRIAVHPLPQHARLSLLLAYDRTPINTLAGRQLLSCSDRTAAGAREASSAAGVLRGADHQKIGVLIIKSRRHSGDAAAGTCAGVRP
jgi:hypothetical protein